VRAGLQQAEADAGGRAVAAIVAADRDAGAVDASRANAERAGVSDVVQFERASLADSIASHVSSSVDEPPGMVLTNPPYGGRVGGRDLRDLYATLGRAASWDVSMLVADRALAGHTKLTFEEGFRTSNGGIPVTFLRHAATPARR
jgi:putative N6-adenine-specific DNA methylase